MALGMWVMPTLHFAHPVAWAEECNLLEDRLGEVERVGEREVRVSVKPYSRW